VTTRTEQHSSPPASAGAAVLEVEDLRVHYFTRRGAARAVDGVSFSLKPGERLALVGESGSGKTTTGLALIGQIKPPGKVVSGRVLIEGEDILAMSDEERRTRLLSTVAMVPQGAMNSLNPVIRVRDQVLDGLKDHGEKFSREEGAARVSDLFRQVGLPPAAASAYPHELSGGMKQRVTIAIAISMNPSVIIADEPTSALDVVVQRQVVTTLKAVQERIGAAAILIGHDMGLMAQFADRVAIMYGGRLVEVGLVRDIFHEPLHPYTRLLISSLPNTLKKRRLEAIPGLPPSLINPPPGCVFHPRCPRVFDRCRGEEPASLSLARDRRVACHLHDGTQH